MLLFARLIPAVAVVLLSPWLILAAAVDIPFESMAEDGFAIFKPFQKEKLIQSKDKLIASPEVWIAAIMKDIISYSKLVETGIKDPKVHAAEAYLAMLLNHLAAKVYGRYELSVVPALQQRLSVSEFNIEWRTEGTDWTFLGATMTGQKRLTNAHDLLLDVINNKVPGDVMETGVWRGGMSVYMRGVLRAYGSTERLSFVCDSFSGLPPSVFKEDKKTNWDSTPYLEVSVADVMKQFERHGMLDHNVVFVKGFFNATMKPLSQHKSIRTFALLRLDGDMYQSTMDVFYHFYDKLNVGGYIIMDDWTGFPRMLLRIFSAITDSKRK